MKERIIRQRWSRNFQAGKEKYKKKKEKKSERHRKRYCVIIVTELEKQREERRSVDLRKTWGWAR